MTLCDRDECRGAYRCRLIGDSLPEAVEIGDVVTEDRGEHIGVASQPMGEGRITPLPDDCGDSKPPKPVTGDWIHSGGDYEPANDLVDGVS